MKLLPSEVSKGLGRADGDPAVADTVSTLDVAFPVEVALAEIVFVGITTMVLWTEMAGLVSLKEAVAELSDSEVGVANGAAVEPKGSPLSCLH